MIILINGAFTDSGCFRKGDSIDGNNIKDDQNGEKVDDQYACRDQCRSSQQNCEGFTYNVTTRECWLKSRNQGQKYKYIKMVNATSGSLSCPGIDIGNNLILYHKDGNDMI